MKIERLELFYVSVPLPATQRLASHPGHSQPRNELTFARLTTDDGIVGEAGGFTLGRFHAGLGDAWGGFVLGRDAADIEGFQHVLEAGAAFGVRIAWLEPALWDILGKAAGLPVYRLLGGARSRMPAYCSTAEIKAPEERAESLLARKAEGFKAAKLRAHSVDWRDDIRMIERAREGYAPHCWSNGFSLIANLHVMAASTNCELCEFPYEPPAWVPESRDALFADPVRLDADGCVPMPRGPGLGLVIDEDQLKKYGEKIYDNRV